MLSHFSCVRLFVTLWTMALQAPLPWDSPGKNTGVGCHALLQVIFPTRGSNPHPLHLLHWQAGSLQLPLASLLWASLVAYLIKNPPAMQETWVQSLGWEDPLEKGKATHSSDSGLENSMDCAAHGRRVRHDWATSTHFSMTRTTWEAPLTVRRCCYCYIASVVSDPVRPHRRQPTRLPRPWDSPGKNTGVGCHFLHQCMKVNSESEVAQPCPTLSDPMDCSLPGSSTHEIFQARVLEWGATAFCVLLCSVS